MKRKPAPQKVHAHKTLWSVAVFNPKAWQLVGLYRTKQEADEVAKTGTQRFVLPPVQAWGGKDLV
jgi:hypothetical protein